MFPTTRTGRSAWASTLWLLLIAPGALLWALDWGAHRLVIELIIAAPFVPLGLYYIVRPIQQWVERGEEQGDGD
jgi:hypothetical protein